MTGCGGRRHGKWVSIWASALAVACAACSGDREAAPQERNAQLKEGAVARVGSDWIEAETVARIAAAQRISVSEARSRAIHDALLAEHARQSGLDSDPRVLVERRGVLAEAFLGPLRSKAEKLPASVEEIEIVKRDHWLELDRPEARRSVHAVVRTQDSDPPQKVKAAQELALRIAAAVKGEVGAAAFLDAAKSVPSEGLEVVAEPLGPVTRDGRVADLEQRPEAGQAAQTFDTRFTEAVWKIERVGDQIGPVRSSFGWHVVMLTMIQPGQQYPPEQLEKMLRDEIVALRAKKALDQELKQISARIPVRVERNAIAITQQLQSKGQEE
jgi:hypothetical protein